MRSFKADMHIHTLLSPCASLEMSPDRILLSAKQQGLDIIAITDHNSTRQVKTVFKMAKEFNIEVIAGVEVCSKEEVHALLYFSDVLVLEEFQKFIDPYLPAIKNKPALFGDQVVVNERNMIVFEEERLLISALNISLKKIEEKVHALGGLFIPAHIERKANGIMSQLGMIPDNLLCDALELSSSAYLEQMDKKSDTAFISNSDAHYPEQIGQASTDFLLKEASFEEIHMALRSHGGRKVNKLRMKA